MKVKKKKAPKESCVLVFVYGTLKRGKALNSWMTTARFVGSDSLSGRMYSLGWYPAAVLGEGGTIPGEVYEMPTGRFRKLRKMEEDAGYRTVDARTKSGTAVKAFEYSDPTIGNRFKAIEDF